MKSLLIFAAILSFARSEISRLTVKQVTGQTAYSDVWAVTKLVDGAAVAWQNCYASRQSAGQGFAQLHLEATFNIHKIRLQARTDAAFGELAEVAVSACNGDTCDSCGKTPAVVTMGSWYEIDCSGKSGNKIELRQTRSSLILGLCEVEIFGETESRKLTVTGVTGKQDHSVPWRVGNLIDNAAIAGQNCYASLGSAPGTPFAQLQLDGTYNIDRVKITARPDSAYMEIAQARVSVCGANGCTLCGETPAVIVMGGWFEVACNGLSGSVIDIRTSNLILGMCEVEVFEATATEPERPKVDENGVVCTDYNWRCKEVWASTKKESCLLDNVQRQCPSLCGRC